MQEMSTTRGMSFEPSAASKDRAERARREADGRRNALRAEARRLDQVEVSYKQHRVPQDERYS